MPKQTLIALGAGVLSAFLWVAVKTGAAGSLMFVLVVPLPFYLVGLSLGSAALVMAIVAGLLVCGLAVEVLSLAQYGLHYAVPAWLIVRLSLLQRSAPDGTMTWYPVGTIMAWLAALGAALLVVTAIYLSGGEMPFRGTVSTAVDEVFKIVLPTLPEGDRHDLAETLSAALPGMAVAIWMMMSVIAAIVSQAMLAAAGKNLRPTPKLADLVLPEWLSWLLVGTAVVALVGGGTAEYVAQNLAIVFAVPYFFVGLGLVHLLARRTPSPFLMLASFYMVIVFLFGLAALLVAGIGLIDQWFGLRGRMNGPGTDQEDE